jgi:hypothetical protein
MADLTIGRGVRYVKAARAEQLAVRRRLAMSSVLRSASYLVPVAITCLVAGPATAQPLSSWSQVISGPDRFELVLFGQAALDEETGLVWQREPESDSGQSWAAAVDMCYRKSVASPRRLSSPGRGGWRLPTMEELTSLIEPGKGLPVDHPFVLSSLPPPFVPSTWTITSVPGSDVYGISLLGLVHLGSKLEENPVASGVWCVRGGHGHDPVH